MWQKLGQLVLNFLLGKLAEWAAAYFQRLKRHKEIDREAEKSTQPLKEAKSGAEIDKATDSALDGF